MAHETVHCRNIVKIQPLAAGAMSATPFLDGDAQSKLTVTRGFPGSPWYCTSTSQTAAFDCVKAGVAIR
jgi:hypothetical protein